MLKCQESFLNSRVEEQSKDGIDTDYTYLCKKRPACVKVYIPNDELCEAALKILTEGVVKAMDEYCPTCPYFSGE